MKTIGHYVFSSLALALLASCIAAGPANAGQITGKFTLPFEAQWGGVTLAAGNYSFTLDNASAMGMLHLVQGQKNIAMITNQGYNPKASERSALVVVQDCGTTSISELRLVGPDVVLYYQPPKAKRGSSTEERQTSQLIPVAQAVRGE